MIVTTTNTVQGRSISEYLVYRGVNYDSNYNKHGSGQEHL